MDQPVPQPSIEMITSAYEEVLEHNRSNTGFGSLFEGILSAAMEAEDANPDASAEETYSAVNKKLEDTTESGDMHGELQSIIHEDAFMRIGISLSAGGLFVKDGEGKRVSSTELKPTLTNTELFVEFVESIGEEGSQNEGILKIIHGVNEDLAERIRLCFGGNAEGLTEEQVTMLPEIGEDALRSFTRLEQAYEKTGLIKPAEYERILSHTEEDGVIDWRTQNDANDYKQQIETLQSYVEYWGRGVLTERIAIGTPESNAEPKYYYFDGLQHMLGEEIDEIIKVINNSTSHDFGLEVGSAKAQALRDILKTMNTEPDHWIIINKGNRKLVEDNLVRLEAKLSS